ncbi:MAG: type IV pilin-like G/H family protein [Cyanobacteria bacterium P01_D01_bin.36]
MTSQIKAKLLQHFAGKKNANGGFTLIELLVVIIIIGILSAIALPSFLNQANKAKQSEAKTYIGSINRAQQAYFMENGTMATNDRFAQLGLGIKTSTESYDYALVDGTANAAGNFDHSAAVADQKATPLKIYAGGVKTATVGTGENVESTTLTVLCEALLPEAAASGMDGSETAYGDYLDQVNDNDATTDPICDPTNMKEL